MPAQALLVPHDFVDRRQYLHARRTLTRLLELGTVPIINENDAIASDEIRYGDNDRIAALVAHNIGAGVLVLLTDLDGLYTADPARRTPTPQLVTRVRVDDPLLSIRAGRGGSGRGSGGMASKLEAARIASWSGVRTVIANAGRAGVLAGAVADEPVGTTFEAHRRKLAARKLWIAFAARVAGTVTVDDGARRALVERQTSLLPAGVVDVAGRFGEGDTVDVAGTDGVAVRPRHGVRRGRRSCARSPAATPATSRPAWPTRSSTATTSSCCPAEPGSASTAHESLGRRRAATRNVRRGRRRSARRPRPGLRPARRPAAGAAGAAEAELGAQLAEAALGLDVGRGLLDLEHAGLDRRLGQLGRRLGLGVAGLDLLLDLGERRHVGADALVELGHRRVHLLLHLRLVELRQQLGLLGELLLQEPAVLGDRRLGLVRRLGRLEDHRLQALDVLLDLDQLVGDRLGGRRVLRRLRRVAGLLRRRRP